MLLIVIAVITWLYYGYRAQYDYGKAKGDFWGRLGIFAFGPPILLGAFLATPHGFIQFFLLQRDLYKTDIMRLQIGALK